MASFPDALPVLSRGKHKNPAKGACFLEYTSLLAGESFSDSPGCVDRELAAVLRHANDLLADADRPRLVPLLGRAVGLVVRTPSGADRHPAAAALHRHVAGRLLAAIDYRPSHAELREYDGGRELDRFFWYLMQRPVAVSSSPAYVARLVDRLHLLHECFEAALDEVGISRPGAAGREPLEGSTAPATPEPAARATAG